MLPRGLAFALVLSCALMAPDLARACQDPPRVPCDLTPEASVVRSGLPFDVVFSMTNLSLDALSGFPAPAEDDLEYTIQVFVEPVVGFECGRRPATQPPLATDPPMPMVVRLDDAWSAAADEPTSLRLPIRIWPGFDADRYRVTVVATAAAGSTRGCTKTFCIDAFTPGDPQFPWAEFVDPVISGDGGQVLPFDLVVHRNGYDPTHPIRVVVLPYNFSDPVDIFPVMPADLADLTRGVIVNNEDEHVTFTCHCHFPCYVGASNVYQVRLTDTVDGSSLWWSDWIGKAFVSRAPLALVELVDLVDSSGNGLFEACEPGQVHLRLIGRHPFANVAMDDMRLELPLPWGVTVASWSLHFHDNPMDAVLPTPAELEATGTVTIEPDRFLATTPRVAYRYEVEPSHPPVFKDMFEVELLLDIAPDALGGASTLDFAGFTVSGVVAGIPRSEVAPTVSIPVGLAAEPPEVSPPGLAPLLMQPDKRTLSWDASAAGRFNVYRGEIADLPRYGDCVTERIATASFTDLDPLPPSRSVFYLVAATTCGTEGSLGTDSMGVERVPASSCP